MTGASGTRSPGKLPGGTFEQLGAQALGISASFAFAFAASLVVFGLIKATIGLRVSPEQEEAGLDIVEHGMYGYPEQFIPSPDGAPPLRPGTPAPAAAMSATAPRPAASAAASET